MSDTEDIVVRYPFTRTSSVPLSSNKSGGRFAHGREALAIVVDASSNMRKGFHHTSGTINTMKTSTPTTMQNQEMFSKKNNNDVSYLKLAHDLISDLIVSHIQDKTDKNVDCIIVVVGTNDTFHHLHANVGGDEVDHTSNGGVDEDSCDGNDDAVEAQNFEQEIPFPHLTEVNGFVEANSKIRIDDENKVNESIEKTKSNWNLMRPSVDMLRQLYKVLKSIYDDDENDKIANNADKEFESNFCDGLILAADSIHRHIVSSSNSVPSSTSKISKKQKQSPSASHAAEFSRRRLLIITDASAQIHSFDPQHMQVVLEGLQRLKCSVDVVGFDFKPEWNIDFSSSVQTNLQKPGLGEDDQKVADINEFNEDNNIEDNEPCDDSSDDSKDDDKEDSSVDDDDGSADSDIDYKEENVKLLRSIVELTKGSIIDYDTYQKAFFDKTYIFNESKRITLRKMVLHIAPNLSVFARFSLLHSEVKLPRLKKKAIMFDDDTNKPLTNALGEEMLSDIQTTTEHYDELSNDSKVVSMSDRTTAYRYGKDLIPISKIDIDGLKYRSPDPSLGGSSITGTLPPIQMSILGYRPLNELPIHLCLGPSYFIVPGSTANEYPARAGTAIANLAKAMENLNKFALCSFIKSKDADTVIGFVMPLRLCDNNTNNNKYALCFTQMPFANEVIPISLPSLQQRNIPKREEDNGIISCHDMIDACTIRATACPHSSSELNAAPAPTLIHIPSLISVRHSMIKRLCDNNEFATYIEPVTSSNPFIEMLRKKAIEDTSHDGLVGTEALVAHDEEVIKEKVIAFQKHFPISTNNKEAPTEGESRKRQKQNDHDPIDYSKY